MISGASQNSFHSAFQLQDVKAGEAGMFIFQGEFAPPGDSSNGKIEFMTHTLQLHIQIHMMIWFVYVLAELPITASPVS
jgi:hypothetical protein